MTAFEMAWWLLVAHAVSDLGLQHEWIGRYKQEYIDGKHNPLWFAVLSAHSIICGGAVSLVTGIWWLGPLEAIWHFITDHFSTHRWISFRADQISHLTAKGAWLIIWMMLK